MTPALRQTLRDVIARLEAASGPDRELDVAIHHIISDAELPDFMSSARIKDALAYLDAPCEHCGVVDTRSILRYTASIDAALTLVPEDRELVLAHCKFELVQCWEAILDTDKYDPERRTGKRDIATAPTPALAICIASLCAKAGEP